MLFDLLWRLKDKWSSGTAVFLMAGWWHCQLRPAVKEGNWFVGREGMQDAVKVRRRGRGLSDSEFWVGNITNLVSCQTSEDDWLVGHTDLNFSTDIWTVI